MADPATARSGPCQCRPHACQRALWSAEEPIYLRLDSARLAGQPHDAKPRAPPRLRLALSRPRGKDPAQHGLSRTPEAQNDHPSVRIWPLLHDRRSPVSICRHVIAMRCSAAAAWWSISRQAAVSIGLLSQTVHLESDEQPRARLEAILDAGMGEIRTALEPPQSRRRSRGNGRSLELVTPKPHLHP